MRTEARKINAVVGLPDEHSFGADYLTRFPIVSNLPRPRDVFDWLGNTGYWQWVDTEQVKDLMGFVNDRLTLQAVHEVIEGFKAAETRGEEVVGKGLRVLQAMFQEGVSR